MFCSHSWQTFDNADTCTCRRHCTLKEYIANKFKQVYFWNSKTLNEFFCGDSERKRDTRIPLTVIHPSVRISLLLWICTSNMTIITILRSDLISWFHQIFIKSTNKPINLPQHLLKNWNNTILSTFFLISLLKRACQGMSLVNKIQISCVNGGIVARIWIKQDAVSKQNGLLILKSAGSRERDAIVMRWQIPFAHGICIVPQDDILQREISIVSQIWWWEMSVYISGYNSVSLYCKGRTILELPQDDILQREFSSVRQIWCREMSVYISGYNSISLYCKGHTILALPQDDILQREFSSVRQIWWWKMYGT